MEIAPVKSRPVGDQRIDIVAQTFLDRQIEPADERRSIEPVLDSPGNGRRTAVDQEVLWELPLPHSPVRGGR